MLSYSCNPSHMTPTSLFLFSLDYMVGNKSLKNLNFTQQITQQLTCAASKLETGQRNMSLIHRKLDKRARAESTRQ